VVRYGPAFAFLGLYIVAPGLRGRGIGHALAAAAADLCGERVLGLDGVVAQQPTYASLGFVKVFSSLRYEALGGGDDPGGVVELAGRWEQALALDAKAFPAPREAFLRQWLNYPGGTALGVAEGGDLIAYGVLRPCQVGHKIGPLFARTPEAAERLFRAFLARAGRGPVYLDAPQNNPAAVALVERHGLTPVFECGRMYRNGVPPWRAELVYGITSFELG
jgi:GNAT superfamily N-acetyltransferase